MPPATSSSGSLTRVSTHTSDRLLASARAGDASAFAQLLARAIPGLLRWAHGRLPRWARTMADTNDLVQDAVLRTVGRLDALDLRGRDALAAYLREAVRNRIRDEHRRVARRGPHDGAAETVADAAPSPLDRVLTAETEARYHAALARMRPLDRELIVAHVELGYTHDQLACMTGRSRNAARMALQRAVTRLVRQMRRR
jgi:RNA polymerase sigma-70 factor (ECF subfamily)